MVFLLDIPELTDEGEDWSLRPGVENSREGFESGTVVAIVWGIAVVLACVS